MKKFPQLQTPRLILNQATEQDIDKIVLYAGHRAIAKTTLNLPHPYTREDAETWINKIDESFKNDEGVTFGIRNKNSLQLIGAIGLHINATFNRAEFGFWMGYPFWNKGYTTEALAAVLEYGFNKINLHKIFAHHLIENHASGKVMLKNNMIQEGILKDHFRKGGIYKTVVQYRLTINEYLAVHNDQH